ncbi:MAG: lipid-A-disaccharide synthase [Campylobacterota bacterium]|nr:lipid-A-disaccharide synthase [Campylobacterota bacterium]
MKLLVCAMEHSSNLHLAALKKELPDSVELIGVFDKKLGTPMIDLSALAIMGFIDALKKLRFFFKLRDDMVSLAKDADKILLMDSSGFNLPLAKSLKKAYPEKEIIYYILPQAWAWKKGRIPVLEKTIDHLASILPFEKDYYSKNAAIEYVGHPLLDEISTFKDTLTCAVRNEEVLLGCNNSITYMPGSRSSEIKRLMPLFHELRSHFKQEAIIVIPPSFSKAKINELYGNLSDFTITHDSHDALYKSDFAFICSGTATLEAALIGTPFILSYIAKPLDYMIARSLVKLEYVGLSNIMFDKMSHRALHPELLQDDVTIEKLLDAYENMDKEAFLSDAITLRNYLQKGSSKRVAEIILEGIIDEN